MDSTEQVSELLICICLQKSHKGVTPLGTCFQHLPRMLPAQNGSPSKSQTAQSCSCPFWNWGEGPSPMRGRPCILHHPRAATPLPKPRVTSTLLLLQVAPPSSHGDQTEAWSLLKTSEQVHGLTLTLWPVITREIYSLHKRAGVGVLKLGVPPNYHDLWNSV